MGQQHISVGSAGGSNSETAFKQAESNFNELYLSREVANPDSGVLNLNMQGSTQKNFHSDTVISDDFTLEIFNAEKFEILTWGFETDAEIDITMPTSPDTLMPTDSGGGWTGGVLTVPAGKYFLLIQSNGVEYSAVLSDAFIP